MRVERGEYEAGSWEMATRPVPGSLAGLVARSTGYREETVGSRRFREPVSGVFPMIFSFGDVIRTVSSPDSRMEGAELVSFAAGMHEGPVVLESFGRQHLMQLDLTPLGAYRLFGGMPLDELTNRCVDVADVFERVGGQRAGGELVERLFEAADWRTRFALLDEALEARLADAPEPRTEVEWAWAQLASNGGSVGVGELADEIGWSRRHFATQFRRHVGVSPKSAARILRFERALDMLVPPSGRSLAFIAASCGYADQAHFSREFKEFAGVTPTEYARNWLPGSGTAA